MSTINRTIFQVLVLWFHVGIGPMIGTGPMQPRQRMRNGLGSLDGAKKQPKTTACEAALTDPNR